MIFTGANTDMVRELGEFVVLEFTVTSQAVALLLADTQDLLIDTNRSERAVLFPVELIQIQFRLTESFV